MTTTTATADELLATLQEGYDLVRSSSPRRIAPGDELVEDLGLDSLDFIDIVSVFESRFSTEVVDRVIDRLPELTTVGDLIAAFLAADAAT
jgi:acyl carrier protein